jgi:gliding motility-associated-like protein
LGEVTVNGTLFYAPTAFTPDYDGLNDVWLPQVTGVTEYVLQVFDRWGELVWSTNDPVVPWLGQFQNGGQFVPNGVYHWVVRLEDQSRLPQRYAGSVSMMR